ncbi:hypothetical protein DOY81_006897 [Sarcophaga bullata]|nr:hypothetical protein DOY81_006897 [Sarcophaga bullata]
MARKKKTPKTNVSDNNNKTATNKTSITPTANTQQTCLPAIVQLPKQECSKSNKSNGFTQHKDIKGDIKDACNNAIVVVAAAVQERNQNQNNCNCKAIESSDDQLPEIKTLKYQSDSELMDLKNYEKNKSNLFLIKSYSFIDKTNNKRKTQQQYGKPPKLKEIKFNDKFTKNVSSMEVKNFKNTEQEKIVKLCEKPEKPKKPPKLKKMKKAKSTHDSTENLHELQQLLRRPTPPSIVLQDEENAKRPLSLPPATANHNHKPVAKAKTLDDIETPRLKRDSFLRHSLQSIRRSFSSSKKSTNPSHISCSSNSSSSSSSNCSSVSVPNRKSFKTKDQLKDVANLSEIEEDANYLIAVKEEEDQTSSYTAINTSTSESCDIITNLNNGNTNDDPIENTSTSHLSHLSPPASALLHSTMDTSSLAVLKEEEEKDFNHNHTHPPCVITEQR